MKTFFLFTWSLFFSLTLYAQANYHSNEVYHRVNEGYIDSILFQVRRDYLKPEYNKYRTVNANINDATVENVWFTAECCNDFMLYDGRVELCDTLNKIDYSLTNVNIAGIDQKTKIGNDVSGILTIVNGKEYLFPLVTYNKAKPFNELIRSSLKNHRKIEIKGRLVKEIRKHKVVPLLLVDDVEETASDKKQ